MASSGAGMDDKISEQSSQTSLLPRSHSEFRSEAYWSRFFEQRGSKAFEWYSRYEELAPLLSGELSSKDEVLHVGCGNSDLGPRLYDGGIKNITNADIVPQVISDMAKLHAPRTGMKWVEMDMTSMGVEAESFDVVLDKGALDAIASEDTMEAAGPVGQYLSEVGRVLKLGGRFLCVSLLQDHVMRWAISSVSGAWDIRVRPIPVPDPRVGSPLKAFLLVFTKLSKTEEGAAVDALAPSRTAADASDGKPEPPAIRVARLRFDGHASTAEGDAGREGRGSEGEEEVVRSWEELVGAVREQQRVHSMLHGLKEQGKGERAELDLHDDRIRDRIRRAEERGNERAAARLRLALGSPRFRLLVLDVDPLRPGMGALIVPKGREHEPEFGSEEGRASLASSTPFGRFVFVYLGANHRFAGMEEAKTELAGAVSRLAPAPAGGVSPKITFLAVSGDDLGRCELVGSATSARSSRILVEDVEDPESKSSGGKGGGGGSGSKSKKSTTASGKVGEEEEDEEEEPQIGWPRLRRMVFEGQRSSVQSMVRVLRDPVLQGTTGAGGRGRRRRGKRRGGGGSGGSADGASSSSTSGTSAAPAPASAPASSSSSWPSSLGAPTRAPPTVDRSFLSLRLHQAMAAVAGAVLVPVLEAAGKARSKRGKVAGAGAGTGRSADVLMLGLGAGSLATWLTSRLQDARVTCVDLDPAVASAARDFFGFQTGPRCSLVIEDALEVARRAAGSDDPESKSDVIVVDVDAGDSAADLSFPPPAFVTQESLETFAKALRPGGALLINLACREDATRKQVLERTRRTFASACVVPVADDVENVVVLAQRPRATAAAAAAGSSDASTGGVADLKPDGDGGGWTAIPLTSAGRRQLAQRLGKLAVSGGMGSVDAAAWMAKVEVDPRLVKVAEELEVAAKEAEEEKAAGQLAAQLAALGAMGGSGSGGARGGAGAGGKKKKRRK